MNALEQLHEKVDQSGWDVVNSDEINTAFQNIQDELKASGNEQALYFSELERQAFAFYKSPEKRISFKMAGEQTLEDGSIVPFEWPDIRTYETSDFDYLYRRFYETQNVYSRTEYGLVLYCANYLKQNQDISFLLQGLIELIKIYIAKANGENYYIVYIRGVLSNALFIASNRKSSPEIIELYNQLISVVFQLHQQADVGSKSAQRSAIDLTSFVIEYYKDFSSKEDVSEFLSKNWDFAKKQETDNPWGAIYIADISIKLGKKMGITINDWLIFKAHQYELLAVANRQNNTMAAVSFIEKAMNIYRGLKDESNLQRLQLDYQQLRTDGQLGQISQELPEEETQRIIQYIQKMVVENTEEENINTLMLTPMINSLQVIRQWSNDSFKETLLSNLFPAAVQDKFGNTIANYRSEEERRQFSLLRTYEFHLQIAVQTILQFFVEGIKTNQITVEGVIAHLRQRWIGQSFNRKINGRNYALTYLSVIEPGIRSLFRELKQWQTEAGYLPNLILATDNLVLKAEYLLREFTAKIGLPTFKPRPKESDVIMERTLDDLLKGLEDKLTEDDHYFIKFILTEKAGYNLRNRVAHGLMDDFDYGLEYPVLALIIILKLSNYQFTPN